MTSSLSSEHTSRHRRLAIAAGFALHEDKLDVILDHGVGLVGLAEKSTSAVFHFVGRVGDFVPDDRRQIVEANGSASLLNRRVKWDDRMSPVILAAGQAYIADHNHQ